MKRIKRVFIYHPDERVRNIIAQRLVRRRNLVIHPVETAYKLKGTLSTVPTCRESVFLVEFRPDSETRLYREVKSHCPFAEVILLISAAHISEAAELVENGMVYDYLIVNPFYDVFTARIKVLRALERCYLRTKLVELQEQLRSAKESIRPAVECLTVDLSQGVKRDSCQLKKGIVQMVGRKDADDQVEGLFGRFDAKVDEKLCEFGDNVVTLTTAFAETVAGKAVNTVCEAVAPGPAQPSETEEESRKVMVISDDAKVRDLLRLFLSTEGFEVVEEQGGVEWVENALKLDPPPSLILLDMDLKDRGSFEILATIFETEILKEIPVVLLTRTKTREILKKAAKYGVSGIILKPFKFSVVKEKVEEALKRRESIDGDSEKVKGAEDSFFIRWRRGEPI